ncbi:MAG: DUF4097 family beta strand repeat-containing protein [Clostridiales bacterium]|nr:DUF4097 family beta strand repeat-containing protein [Clostridiales bacterium]
MKKIHFASLYLILMISLAACQSPSKNTESQISSSEETVADTEILQSTTAAQSTNASETSIPSNANQVFRHIQIELRTGTVEVISGDKFSLTQENGEEADYSISDDTLHISTRNAHKLVLTLPDGNVYDTVSFSIDKGHIISHLPFCIKDLNLDLSDGEANLEQLSVSDTCNIYIRQGSAFLSGTFAGTVDAECREGHLQIKSSESQSDYNYTLTTSNGNIRVGDKGYHGIASQLIDNGSDYSMTLSCVHGDISVEFQ